MRALYSLRGERWISALTAEAKLQEASGLDPEAVQLFHVSRSTVGNSAFAVWGGL